MRKCHAATPSVSTAAAGPAGGAQLKPLEAQRSADDFARLVYAGVFDWLVRVRRMLRVVCHMARVVC